ncbi:MAG TPA: arginine deiminase-related protein, partial [Xanthomonadales bacterium]|nr:arginine deiminase-related protein [Xanthomonadales bacterium]
PADFRLARESASDNAYMQMAQTVDPQRASAQHQGLARALAHAGIPTHSFAGHPDTPDAVFPNNVFATAPGRLIVGAMRHRVRQREAERADIRAWFRDLLGYRQIDLSLQPIVAELTGSLVIDRARGVGYCGLSERCDRAGAAAMAQAFGLDHVLVFDLAPGEYHTNVVMSALAGRGLLLCPDGFADPAVAAALAGLDGSVVIDTEEKAGYVGNCIALGERDLWMSACALRALRPASRNAIEALGLQVQSVELDELEKAGGSLRCMIGEIY